MKTYLLLEASNVEELPPGLAADDVRYPTSLVEYFLHAYTRAGDTVLDPFAGFGTTLIVAERLGRIPFGIELDESRVIYARTKLTRPENLILGDSRTLGDVNLPTIDFSMTSPPYMNQDDDDDPFAAYRVKGSGYAAYLRDMRDIYAQLGKFMRPGGTVVMEVANLKHDGHVTTLAWDIAKEVASVFRFEGEVVVCWDKYGYGYDHSYCLVYSALR